MFNLFLDTTQDYCHIAIFDKNRIISKVSIKTNNNLTDLVVEHIDQLIKKSKIKHKDINAIYILNGPGSFTGVKVNTIIAKT
jgi:tRNA A37 threonylcarbamoyladenosine modification protein TsaB